LETIGKILGIDEEKIEEAINFYLKKNEEKLNFYKKELKGKKVFICHGAQRALNYMGPIMDELGMEVVGVATYFANKENYGEIVKKLPKGAIIIDNPNTYELEKALMECVPDVFISDSKTKELVHKMGIPYINGRAPDTVYVGFDGFINFAEDVYGAINSKIWGLIR
jgi:nitrogenase molybdenum-iron protein alpha chain